MAARNHRCSGKGVVHVGDSAHSSPTQASIEDTARSFDIWNADLNDDPNPILRELQDTCSKREAGWLLVRDVVRRRSPGLYRCRQLLQPHSEGAPTRGTTGSDTGDNRTAGAHRRYPARYRVMPK
jgi:hypothetical protein